MTQKTRRGASYDDVITAPNDKIAEMLGGDLYLSPRPTIPHARVLSALGSDLHDAFDRGRSGPGGWWILHEPEIHLSGDVLVPDLAGWRRERLPRLPDAAAFELSPDWICEVLSSSTEMFDRNQKMPRYALAGVAHLWIVDLRARRLEIYARSGSELARLEIHAGETVVSAPPFDGVAIDLSRVWS
ncbi:MAG TPA: Uma2 family endonuclease [Thermoanaerobaculia bacterium]|nr:Uma2 family endonuclease [Thermoanaerobaculia bacterium]